MSKSFLIKLVVFMSSVLIVSGCSNVNENNDNCVSSYSTYETQTSYCTNKTSELTSLFCEPVTTTIVTDPPKKALELSDYSFYADDNHTKICGRTFIDKSNVRWLGYTCSSISFSFYGTKASITLMPNSMDLKKNNLPYFCILVNGEEVIKTTLDKENTFNIVNIDKPAQCEISVIKLSEATFSAIGVKEINVTAQDEPVPTAKSKYKIEFIGDSLTCGYGVESDNQFSSFSTDEENGCMSYASLTANMLNADYNIIAMSGIGIVSRYTARHIKNTDDFLMPDLYKYTDGFRSNDIWNYNNFTPDLCVIALGANDNSYTNESPERELEFKTGYKAFIDQVRKMNPNASILCVSGIQKSNLADVVKLASEEYSDENNDNNIFYFKFNSQNESEGYGADYHPSSISQRRFSNELYNYILEIMNWQI